MPELRRDPITHRWAIIATERAMRPKSALSEAEMPNPGRTNPFVAGHENMTPPEVYAVRPSYGRPNDSTWRVRVVPNKYPALKVEGNLDRRASGIYDMMNGIGAHEVIIEAPTENFKFCDLPTDHLIDVVRTYRERMRDLARDQRFKFSMLFRNHGAASGATVQHGHTQLIALPIVPSEVQVLLDGAKRYYEFRERNVFADIIRYERSEDRRFVYENDDFAVITPFASRVPFETWIIPKFQAVHFENLDDKYLGSLVDALSLTLRRLDRNLGDPPYNFILQTAPYSSEEMPWYRWHIQILPKLTNVAGFELGTGFYINSVAPEEAARVLKKIQ